jgi:hypothetical protein
MKNRKIKVGLVAAALIVAGFVFKTFIPGAPFSEFTTGIVSLAGLYFASNAAQKLAPSKDNG